MRVKARGRDHFGEKRGYLAIGVELLESWGDGEAEEFSWGGRDWEEGDGFGAVAGEGRGRWDPIGGEQVLGGLELKSVAGSGKESDARLGAGG